MPPEPHLAATSNSHSKEEQFSSMFIMFINVISLFHLFLHFLIFDNENVHVEHKVNRVQRKLVTQGCNSYPRLNRSSGPLASLNSKDLSFSLMHV